MNYNNEKLKDLAAVIPENELDEMFDDRTVGGVILPTNLTIIPSLVCAPGISVKFNWCPTNSCTPTCRS